MSQGILEHRTGVQENTFVHRIFLRQIHRGGKFRTLMFIELEHSYGRHTSYEILSSVPSNFVNRIHVPFTKGEL
jgi:hypothetical protein